MSALPVAPTGSRKVVTLVFADLAGSTSLQERMDAESVRRVMDRFYAAMRDAVAAHEGTVVKFMGDGLMAAFGVPTVSEDDAVRAVRAAAAMHEAFVVVADEVRRERDAHVGLRVGVNTGEVVVAEGEDDVVGDAVNVAARLEHAAAEGQVLVGHETWRFTRDLFTFEEVPPLDLKGKSERVAAYRLVSLAPPAAERASPFVGRGEEIARLTAAFEAAVEERRARLVTVIGSPGLGKSRMARELSRRLAGRAVTYEGQCAASGSSTFAPVADVLREIAGIDETSSADDAVTALTALFTDIGDQGDAGRIATAAASILGVGRGVSPEETFWAVRRVIEQAAGGQPAIMVFDDVHWAEPILLDLLDHLAEWIRDAPVLLVVLARPEIRDVRAALADPAATPTDVVVLDALGAEEGTQLAAELLEDHPLDEDVAAHLLRSAEGNPLFLRELVKMLVDDAVLHIEDGVWVAADGVEELEVPPTIHALIAARIERLESEERSVVERASVVGHQFFRGAVAVLSPPPVAKQIDTHLETLRRKEVVEPEGTYWIDEPVFRFHHALIRDAAYRRLLKEARAELHERVADWLASKAGDLVGEHEEIIGYHLEQAYGYRRDLDGLDDDVVGLGRRAADRLAAAARRSLERDDQRSAAALMGRALACLPPGDSSRAELLVDRCEALLGMGQIAAGAEAVAELEVAAGREPALAAWAETFAAQIASFSEPEALPDWVGRAAAAADRFEALGDAAGTAKACAVHASILARLGQVAACEAALDRALAAARDVGDRRLANGVLAGAPLAALWGPSPVTRAAGRCLDVVRVLRITTDSPPVEAVALRAQAVLEAFRGRFEAARRLLASSRRTLEELGLRHGILQTDLFEGLVELAAEEFAAAEAALRRAYDGFRALGVEADAGQAGALLARACLAQGRDDEALELTEQSQRLGGHDLKTTIAWRAVRAEALARREETDEALRLAREAVDIAGTTDALVDHADARLALASVLAGIGDTAAAEEEAQRAAELYEAKGATALAERARGLTGTVPPHPTTTEQPVHQSPGHDSALTNLATAAFDAYTRLVQAKDVEAIVALVAPDYVMEERRRTSQTTVSGRDGVRQLLDVIFELELALEHEVLATRLDRLSLVRIIAHGRDPLGGASEFRSLRVDETDEQGLLVHSVSFDPDDLDAAYDELDRRFIAHEGIPEDEWFGSQSAVARAYSTGDADGLLGAFFASPDVDVVDHRPAGWGRVSASEFLRLVAAMTELISVGELRRVGVFRRQEPFSLVRQLLRGAGPAGDEFELVYDAVVRAEGGRVAHLELYDPGDFDQALARFDELTGGAETEPPSLVAAVWEQYRDLFPQGDIDGILTTVSPDYVLEERQYHAQHTSTGREGYRKLLAAIFEGQFTRVDAEVLATRGPRLALVRVAWQIRAKSGGEFEVVHLRVDEADDSGLLTHTAVFDADDFDTASGELDRRYHELPGGAAADPLVETTVLEIWDRGRRATSDGDLDALLAVLADDVTYEERTRSSGLGTKLEGKEAVKKVYTAMFAGDVGFPDVEVVATRGNRLLLTRATLRWSDRRGGTTEHPHLRLDETNDEGKISTWILFDLDDLDAAFDELDQRYLGHVDPSLRELLELATAARRAYNERDWDRFRSYLADGLVVADRRPAGWGEIDADAYVEHLRGLAELADVRLWGREVTRVQPGAMLIRSVVAGAGPEEGSVEYLLDLLGISADGKFVRFEIFDDADHEDAVARFDELVGASSRKIGLGNFALEVWERNRRATVDGDLDALLAVLADDVTYEERRLSSGLGTKLEGKEAVSKAYTAMFAGDVEFPDVEVVATRGDRLLLTKVTLRWSDQWGGTTEHPLLRLDETNDEGKISAWILFDPDDLDAAMDELDERHLAHVDPECRPIFETTRSTRRAYNTRDWEAWRALCAPDALLIDHRLAGWGECDLDGFLERIFGIVALAPDIMCVHAEAVRIAPHCALNGLRFVGTDDEGGTFEIGCDMVTVFADGLFQRSEWFDPSNRQVALARYEELAAEPTGRLHSRNLALHAWEQVRVSLLAGEVDPILANIADDMSYEERRSAPGRFELTGRAEIGRMLTTMARNPPVAIDTEVIATRGSCLVLTRHVFRGSDHAGGGEYESPVLRLDKTDDAGILVATVVFDGEDLDAAFEELEALFGATLPPQQRPVLDHLVASRRSYNAHDWDAVHLLLSDEFVLVDHRPGWFGTLDREGYLERLEALPDFVPDASITVFDIPRIGATACVAGWAVTGTSSEGGAIEIAFYSVGTWSNGRTQRFEFFSLEERDRALSRFEELTGEQTPDTAPTGNLISTPNQAMRVMDEIQRAMVAGDFEGVVAYHAPNIVFEERRRTSLGEYGSEQLDAWATWLQEDGVRYTDVRLEPLAVRGDHLVLGLQTYRTTDTTGGDAEFSWLLVTELDGDGLVSAFVMFEPDDIDAAVEELDHRFEQQVSGDLDPALPAALGITRAYRARDWGSFRAIHADDYRLVDHRPTGWGECDLDAYIERLQSLLALAPDIRLWIAEMPRLSPTAAMFRTIAAGAGPEGGGIEIVVDHVSTFNDGRVHHQEYFPPERRDETLIRFEQLARLASAGPVVQLWDRFVDALQSGDLSGLGELVAPGYTDHDHINDVVTDAAAQLENQRVVASTANLSIEWEPVLDLGRQAVWHARHRWTTGGKDEEGAGDDAGLAEHSSFMVGAVDESGRATESHRFAEDQLHAALAVVEQRHAETTPEQEELAAARRFARLWQLVDAYNRGDWDTFRTIWADELVTIDHRPAGWGSIEGADAYVTVLQDLAVSTDRRWIIRDLLHRGRRSLAAHWSVVGTDREGGRFELSFLVAYRFDDDGAVTRQEIYPVDRPGDAVAAAEALDAGSDP